MEGRLRLGSNLLHSDAVLRETEPSNRSVYLGL